jgi:hypothetical protein
MLNNQRVTWTSFQSFSESLGRDLDRLDNEDAKAAGKGPQLKDAEGPISAAECMAIMFG